MKAPLALSGVVLNIYANGESINSRKILVFMALNFSEVL